MTHTSDIDWIFLIDGQADLVHQGRALAAAAEIEQLSNKTIGPEGTFGKMAFSHDVVQYIGGGEDSNANFTRRMLLLLESQPIGRREAYDRVVRVVLERYLTGDHGWMRGRAFLGVPRFLLNDIVRYWRTVAVDFAYKQWTRDNKGWALRSATLRLSRKLIYAAGLLFCFSFAGLDWYSDQKMSRADRKLLGLVHLSILQTFTPLDVVANVCLNSPPLHDAARSIFGAYDEFLGILTNASHRTHLESLMPDAADGDDLWNHIRELGTRFQNGLDAIFFDVAGTRYPELIRRYGVFGCRPSDSQQVLYSRMFSPRV